MANSHRFFIHHTVQGCWVPAEYLQVAYQTETGVLQLCVESGLCGGPQIVGKHSEAVDQSCQRFRKRYLRAEAPRTGLILSAGSAVESRPDHGLENLQRLLRDLT